MDERRPLLERVYSREGAAEQPRDYVDLKTGSTVRMTPSQWALAEFDREHASADVPNHTPSRPLPPTLQPDRLFGDPDTDAQAESPPTDANEQRSREHPLDGRIRRLRRTTILGAVGAFVLGIVVMGIVWASAGAGRPTASPTVAKTVTLAPDDSLFHPLPGPAIEEYFRKAEQADVLPADVTRGFLPTSFHLVAGAASLQESSSIYAAKRLDDQICLVAVVGGSRAAETCSTVTGIALHGLSLTKDAVRSLDGRPETVTVTWQTDGTITWAVAPSVG
ncbi:MAG TPA: hypothetical protein VG369_09995 [Humibacter sp.]|jgi:hypothetical protein|nr:hypothetical protein [Humibacter sp.]